MLIYRYMQEPTEKNQLQDRNMAQARVERAPTRIFPNSLWDVGAHYVLLGLVLL
jgi:hypothetical protein